MVNSRIESSAVVYLTHVMRSRTPSYVPDVGAENSQVSHRASLSRSPKGDLVLRTDSVLSQAIPAEPAYNKQRLYALDAIVAARLHDLEPMIEADATRISTVINAIHSKEPRFATTISANVIADLNDNLETYASISDSANPFEFPQIAVLGYRVDEPILDARRAISSSRKIKDWKQHTAELKYINTLLDEIVPDGAFYNRVRQAVIDEVRANGNSVRPWLLRKQVIDAEMYNTGVRFISNEHHHRKNGVMVALDDILRPSREALQKSQKSRNPRPLTLNEAVEIASLIQRHHSEKEEERANSVSEPVAKRLRLDGGDAAVQLIKRVPDDFKAAVRREIRARTPCNSIAKNLGDRVVSSMEAVISPSRDNFYRRMRFLKNVSDNRDYWLEPGTVDPQGRPILSEMIKSGYFHTFKNKKPEVEVLVRNLEHFHQAWQGRLREVPPIPLTIQQTPPPTALIQTSLAAEGGHKRKLSRKQRELEKSGQGPGQTKLGIAFVKTKQPTGQDAGPSNRLRPSTHNPSARQAHHITVSEEDANLLDDNGRVPLNRKRSHSALNDRSREPSTSR